MNSLNIKSRILLTTSICLVTASLAITFFVAHRALEHRQSSYENSIYQLIFSTKIAISSRQQYDRPYYQDQLKNLLLSPEVSHLTLINEERAVIAHVGDDSTPPINPNRFPITGTQIISLGNLAVYIETLPMQSASGEPQQSWLIALVDRTSLQAQQEKVIKTAVIIFIFSSLISILMAKYLLQQVRHVIARIKEALISANKGSSSPIFPQLESEDLHDHEQLLTEISSQIYRYKNDVREEIEQNTQDLRETLETIEIQNVELDLARKKAIKANKAKTEFLANMSHEIRTPLNSIIGFSKILMRSPLNMQQMGNLRAIQKSSEVLLSTINDILDFSKVEAGRIALEKESISLYELIEDVVVMLAPSAHNKGLELNYLYYDDVPGMLDGDSLRIKQIIANLVNNAIKFTETGEIIVRVMLDDSLKEETDNLKIAISDTGLGLSDEEKLSIFSAFSQADASTARQFGGTGLGLSICRGLVHEMGGTIRVESELDKGSTFWFTLPIENPVMQNPKATHPKLENQSCYLYEPHHHSKQNIIHTLNYLNIPYQQFDTLKELISAIEQDGKNDTQTNRFALISLSDKELEEECIYQAFKCVNALDINILTYTPSLLHYDYKILRQISVHMTKPATYTNLSQSLVSALNKGITSDHAEEYALPHFANNATILAVDDNEMNLSLVKALVKEMGIDIDLADSAEQAIDLCKKQYYPLILMDIQMPDMDGIEGMKRIKTLSNYYDHNQIIALTAFALPNEKDAFIEQGFVDLLTKPLNEQKLAETIKKYLPELAIENPVQDEPKVSAEIQAFNWNEAVYLCNNNSELAKDFTNNLIAVLPSTRSDLEMAMENNDTEQLGHYVHKLHGLSLLCGTPKLRHAVKQAEIAIKTEEPANIVLLKTQQTIQAINELEFWFESTDDFSASQQNESEITES
ncbi:hypothetical protein A3715_07800 [Oleiphilus sp. HI0009]|uniref:ATP-binding protein n=4 Tax=unclassified Oleiphilus TaxID=2631174 RepID=UPI0007C23E34|nr:ATP-binding protein [Oleiphilus sp. HI0066]KZX80760.1 hypothetical protein A3715_07800 [Oleiphilus sp. HI0009]